MTETRTVTVGPKGQVVIPKEVRKRVGIEPGQRVRVDEADGEVRVRRALPLDELQGIFKGAPGAGTAELERERRREVERELRKSKR
jgi:AbrB family looped-hinge helix DNA binding protein